MVTAWRWSSLPRERFTSLRACSRSTRRVISGRAIDHAAGNFAACVPGRLRYRAGCAARCIAPGDSVLLAHLIHDLVDGVRRHDDTQQGFLRGVENCACLSRRLRACVILPLIAGRLRLSKSIRGRRERDSRTFEQKKSLPVPNRKAVMPGLSSIPKLGTVGIDCRRRRGISHATELKLFERRRG